MNVADFVTPVFIAKIIDFVVFVGVLVWLWNRFGLPILGAQQEAQNKVVQDAAAYREQSERALEEAKRALERAKLDSVRMVDVGAAQAARLVADERSAAEQHGTRIVAHASGELERERYRVRHELLAETVDKAHAAATKLVARELSPASQQGLIGQLISSLEQSHGD